MEQSRYFLIEPKPLTPEHRSTRTYIILFVVIILFIIILVLIIIFARRRTPTPQLSDLDGPCSSNNDCLPGLVCSSGKCKRADGTPCSLGTECQSGICFNGICQPFLPPPTPPIPPTPPTPSWIVSHDKECQNYLFQSTTQPLSMTCYHHNYLFLIDNGAQIVNQYQETFNQPQFSLNHIFTFGHNLYSSRKNKIYIYHQDNDQWKHLDGMDFPNSINFISVSGNGKLLFIQTCNRGYLYQCECNDEIISLYNYYLPDYQHCVYGSNSHHYVIMDTRNYQLIKMMNKDVVNVMDNIVDGTIMSDNHVVVINNNNISPQPLSITNLNDKCCYLFHY